MKKNYWYALLMGFVMLSCAEPPAPQGYQVAQPDANPSYQGFYVLNEGTMGANKATLDNFKYHWRVGRCGDGNAIIRQQIICVVEWF